MKITKKSLDIVRDISNKMEGNTFHHHYHILYDIGEEFNTQLVNYVEIGCYAGGSACLMIQRPNTNVVSIDLGSPISPNIVKRNVDKFNKLNNSYTYLQGNSQTSEMVNRLTNLIDSIDILFIDGDHSYQGVLNDFSLYYNLVRQGGYIIFDDYADFKYSPQVKIAVDYILENFNGFEIIGVFGNEFGARGECPSISTELYNRGPNEFVIKKNKLKKCF